MKEYKVGEEIIVVEKLESMSCKDCIFFGNEDVQMCTHLACVASERSDDKNVIFVEKGK